MRMPVGVVGVDADEGNLRAGRDEKLGVAGCRAVVWNGDQFRF